jgi:hypothetical protein
MKATCRAHLLLLNLTSTAKHTLQGGAEIMNFPTKNPDHKVKTPELLYVQFIISYCMFRPVVRSSSGKKCKYKKEKYYRSIQWEVKKLNVQKFRYFDFMVWIVSD